MHGAKIEVALWWDVGNVGGDFARVREVVDQCGDGWVVDCGEHHGGVVEVGGLEGPVDVGDLVLGDAVGDFGNKPRGGADDGYEGVGIEEV